MNKYIGVDLGTSGLKLVLIDKNGKLLNSVTVNYKVSNPKPNFSEQNPQDWWNAIKEGIPQLVEKNDTEIKGLSFSGQMHGLVMLDKFDHVIRPCILWNDNRSEEFTDYLNNKFGKDKLNELTGNIAFSGFTAPKIMWVKKYENENFKKINKIMLPKDYLIYKFSKRFVTDYSDAAGTLLLDVKNKKWSLEMIKEVGIELNVLPSLLESYDVVNKIDESVALELGLNKDLIIVAGGADNAIAAIGTNTINDNSCNISLGTSGTILISTDSFHSGETLPIHSFNHATGKYYLMGCILSAASAYSWWNSLANLDINKEIKFRENNVFFAPYLSGERCPYNDPNIKGAFINLSSSNTSDDLSLAVLEGVAFALKDCLEIVRNMGIKINKSTLCGGGSKSNIWPNIIANVLDIDIELIGASEGPGIGAAILAMVANKEYKSINEAVSKVIKINKVIKKDNKLVEYYKKKYLGYKNIYRNLKNISIS